jgi:hypothetical protein
LRSSGATILHGPHHGAQKSTSTGRVDRLISASNAKSLGTSTGSLGGQLGLAFAATKCPLQRFVLETIALPTFWASHEQSVIVCSNHTHNEVSWLEVCPRVIWILSSAI